MLVEIAVGDSYGAGFEFAKPDILAVRKNDLSTYYPHSLPGHLPPGSYTDDTQMSVALAEAIINNDPWNHKTLAERFVQTYKRDPRNGYSRRLQSVLESVKNGEGLRAMIVPLSDRCGAAMRSCPIGVYPDEWHVVELARKQATLTHNTREGQISSVAIALSVNYFLFGKGLKAGLVDFLEGHSFTSGLFENGELWAIEAPVTSHAMPCAKAAISAVVRNNSMAACLKECIAYTGDVDSVAAMAMGIASTCNEIENDLPNNLFLGLENGRFGLDYLRELDKKLLGGIL
jgi:ADP-ribosylglycohydrolase